MNAKDFGVRVVSGFKGSIVHNPHPRGAVSNKAKEDFRTPNASRRLGK
ncbi:MAG: hypothetical protein H0W88_03415 [Parachlamydiaceae bacterium]|nr:hypothetical protein [Parachlamydiaceae bacterium]